MVRAELHRWTLLLVGLGLGSWCHAPAEAVSLQSLLDGSSLMVGNARLSDWQLISADATSGTLPNWTLVSIVPLAGDPLNPGFQLAGNGQLSISGLDALDVIVKFQVSSVPGGNTFRGQALALTGLTFGGASGTTVISQEAVDPSQLDLGPTLVMADNQANVLITSDDATFAPTANLTVTLNLFEQGLGTLDSINLSTLTSRFAQTGPAVLGGDYNNDGEVNIADYTVWRNHLGGAAGSLTNDVDGGVIGIAHYARWKNNFGAGSPAVFTSAATAVPEPFSGPALLLFVAGGAVFSRRRARVSD